MKPTKNYDFLKCLNRKVLVQGLSFLKIREFTFVNDCFRKGRNAEIGLFGQTLKESSTLSIKTLAIMMRVFSFIYKAG